MGEVHIVNAQSTTSATNYGAVVDSSGNLQVALGVSPIQFVDVAMTPEASALDTGDVIAATQVVANATRAADEPAILESLTLIDLADQKAIVTAVFFSANTSLGTEDAAPDIDDTEMLTVLGSVEIVAADYIDLGGASYVCKKNIGLIVKPATGTRDIYMALYTPATSTPTYGAQTITVRLGFRSI